VEVEVTDVGDVLDVIEEEGDYSAGEVKQVDGAVANKAGQSQVSGEGFASEAADDDLFVGRGHGSKRESGGLSHGAGASREKGATCVVNTLMLCYTYVLCPRIIISINA
jgi:hypothetical protein